MAISAEHMQRVSAELRDAQALGAANALLDVPVGQAFATSAAALIDAFLTRISPAGSLTVPMAAVPRPTRFAPLTA